MRSAPFAIRTSERPCAAPLRSTADPEERNISKSHGRTSPGCVVKFQVLGLQQGFNTLFHGAGCCQVTQHVFWKSIGQGAEGFCRSCPPCAPIVFSPNKNTRTIGNPLGPLGTPSHTSGMGSTRVTLSCGIRRSRYGWMSLASCSAKKQQLGKRWENDGKYNSSVRDVIEIRNAHSQEIQTIRLDKS